jgi:hypothetical protein
MLVRLNHSFHPNTSCSAIRLGDSQPHHVNNGCLSDTSLNHSFAATPRYTQRQIRKARAIIRNCNNISAESIATTIDNHAWSNLDQDISGSIFREIGSRRDNIVQLLTSSKKDNPGGSGIRLDIPGETIRTSNGKLKRIGVPMLFSSFASSMKQLGLVVQWP